jgi:hypothetical protein
MSLSPSAFQLSPSSTQLLQHHIQTGIAPQDIYGNAIFQTPNVGGYGPISRISRLIPSDGPIYGGVEVTVLGNNFYSEYLDSEQVEIQFDRRLEGNYVMV